jgi:LmbE family N-acetylglucosaminyl deacetylase
MSGGSPDEPISHRPVYDFRGARPVAQPIAGRYGRRGGSIAAGKTKRTSMSMLGFNPDFKSNATVLCLGAHCDDIEIGCAGALLELRQRYPALHVVWTVFSGTEDRTAETRSAAARLLGGAGYSVNVHRFRGSYFPSCTSDIKDAFETIKAQVNPDLIFTHFLQDRHQDHRVIAELTWNTFRDHAILEYEIAKFEGDLGQPNVYVPLARANMDLKVSTLMDSFPSQHSRTWFDPDLFKGHMRLRGMECNAPSRYAEAFHARKLRV